MLDLDKLSIKPCPFCGHPPQVLERTTATIICGRYNRITSYALGCSDEWCYVSPQGKYLTDLETVVAAWNQRLEANKVPAYHTFSETIKTAKKLTTKGTP